MSSEMEYYDADNFPLHIEDDEPTEWVCGGCAAYWFEEPSFSHCPFCGQDAICPVYSTEEDFSEWQKHDHIPNSDFKP